MTSKNAKLRALNVYYSNFRYGGLEQLIITLAQRRNMMRSVDLFFAFFPQGPFCKKFEGLDSPVIPLCLEGVHLRNPLSVMRARRRFIELLKLHAIDLVVVHNFEPWLWFIIAPAIRSARLPLVLWVHSVSNSSNWVDRWARRTRPDLAICNSHFSRQELEAVFPNATAEVLYCPVDPPRFDADGEKDRLVIRAHYAVGDGDTILIQASRLDERKGHLLLLDALSRLRDVSRWSCWQVGGPQFPHEVEYAKRLSQRANDLNVGDRIRFLGYQEQVGRFLNASDLYCQPNVGPESFGLSFVEALSAKLPVITTAIGGALEIVDESCGILTPPNDADALASALATLIRNKELRVRLGANGPARARQLCDPEKQMRQLEAILFKVHSLRQSTKRQ